MAAKKNEEVKRWPLDLPAGLVGDMDDLFKERGIVRAEAIRRIFRWFLDAPSPIQQDMIGQIPDDMRGDFAGLLQRYMARDDTPADPAIVPSNGGKSQGSNAGPPTRGPREKQPPRQSRSAQK